MNHGHSLGFQGFPRYLLPAMRASSKPLFFRIGGLSGRCRRCMRRRSARRGLGLRFQCRRGWLSRLQSGSFGAKVGIVVVCLARGHDLLPRVFNSLLRESLLHLFLSLLKRYLLLCVDSIHHVSNRVLDDVRNLSLFQREDLLLVRWWQRAATLGAELGAGRRSCVF
jgi:hypothetical protein